MQRLPTPLLGPSWPRRLLGVGLVGAGLLGVVAGCAETDAAPAPDAPRGDRAERPIDKAIQRAPATPLARGAATDKAIATYFGAQASQALVDGLRLRDDLFGLRDSDLGCQ